MNDAGGDLEVRDAVESVCAYGAIAVAGADDVPALSVEAKEIGGEGDSFFGEGARVA